jgi:hypothetical protein
MRNSALFSLIFFILSTSAVAQVFTKEDSLHAGLVRSNQATVISGYGQAKVQYDMKYKTADANITRNVLFIGHKFSKKVYFFSEMELENAGVSSTGGFKGELSMEQLFLKFNVNRDVYLTAGLFIPRIGIINENHLPTTFNGNDRTFVETFLIPATWRELGVGIYGNVRRIPGLNYSAAILNGLNSGGFNNGTGIADGRFEGSQATASNIAVTGALLYYYKNWRMQASGYFGGTAGLVKRVADSLQLKSGPFGTPVGLVEANVQYYDKGVSFKALVASAHIPDAFRINRAYANNTPTSMLGAYAEAGYNILHALNDGTAKNLTLFARYEWMDLNQNIPSNGIYNATLKKTYVVTGLTFQPTQGVVVKLDYVLRQTGDRNPELVVTPFPSALPYYKTNGFVNLGFGYSF